MAPPKYRLNRAPDDLLIEGRMKGNQRRCAHPVFERRESGRRGECTALCAHPDAVYQDVRPVGWLFGLSQERLETIADDDVRPMARKMECNRADREQTVMIGVQPTRFDINHYPASGGICCAPPGQLPHALEQLHAG